MFAGDVRKREDLLSASITVATAKEIKQLFLSYQAAGVFSSGAEEGAVGRQNVRRHGSGWESHSLCWAGGVKCGNRKPSEVRVFAVLVPRSDRTKVDPSVHRLLSI